MGGGRCSNETAVVLWGICQHNSEKPEALRLASCRRGRFRTEGCTSYRVDESLALGGIESVP